MKFPQDWSNMTESWTLADKASGRILNMFRNYEGMNNYLCSVMSKIFAYKPNITKMEKGRLTDCINMKYHTKGLIKDDSNISCTGGAGHSLITYINRR